MMSDDNYERSIPLSLVLPKSEHELTRISSSIEQLNRIKTESPITTESAENILQVIPLNEVFTNSDDPDININENHCVKVSAYTPPINSQISTESSVPKLKNYFTINSRLFYGLILLIGIIYSIIIISLAVILSRKIASLTNVCPQITYCPMDNSYIVICDILNGTCKCYDPNDNLFGCFSQRYYQQGCYREHECSSKYNLMCNLNMYQCDCISRYYYNGTICLPLSSYGQNCSTIHNYCDSSLNLTCINNQCTCNTNITFWNNHLCETYRSVNSPCDPYSTITSGCKAPLICDNTTYSCQCSSSSSSYFDGTVCLSYGSYLKPCYNSSFCLPSTLLQCVYGVCQCDDYSYWSGNYCLSPKIVQLNVSCTDQSACEYDYGLKCVNNICSCELNSYWTSGNYCDTQATFGERCQNKNCTTCSQCVSYTNLYCSNSTNVCTCPQNYFWDGFVCQQQRLFQSFCGVDDTWCRNDLGLKCLNYLCSCAVCSTCFWDGIRCRDCPTSWQIVNATNATRSRVYCYNRVNSYLDWTHSSLACLNVTSFFGPTSHLVYIDDNQELSNVATFATSSYYDIFIGHKYSSNTSQWFLGNGTVSPTMQFCASVPTSFTTDQCARILIGSTCITNIMCSTWTSRFVCELD